MANNAIFRTDISLRAIPPESELFVKAFNCLWRLKGYNAVMLKEPNGYCFTEIFCNFLKLSTEQDQTAQMRCAISIYTGYTPVENNWRFGLRRPPLQYTFGKSRVGFSNFNFVHKRNSRDANTTYHASNQSCKHRHNPLVGYCTCGWVAVGVFPNRPPRPVVHLSASRTGRFHLYHKVQSSNFRYLEQHFDWFK